MCIKPLRHFIFDWENRRFHKKCYLTCIKGRFHGDVFKLMKNRQQMFEEDIQIYY